jgi:hypothetical protein
LTLGSLPNSNVGIINNGVIFAGASTLGINSNSTLQVTGDFTFSFWMYLINQTSTIFLYKGDPTLAGALDYGIQYTAGAGYECYIGGPSSGTQSAKVGAATSNGVWTHVVMWYDHLTGQVYLRLNDTTTYQSTTAPALTQTAHPFVIGGVGVYYAFAVIDEVGFWKRKLTAAEITALYNAGVGLPFSSFTA